MKSYRSLFFDLDDTLWAFHQNARDTLEEMYLRLDYGRFFTDFGQFLQLYEQRNLELWDAYGRGEVTKDELNRQRFLYPLEAVGAGDASLARTFMEGFFSIIPGCRKLMPHCREVLDYLRPRYRLYILSNGFEELQCRKMRSAGIDGYFRRVVLSDEIGLLKPRAEIFHFALSATQSELRTSLMIGDSWKNDVAGAAAVGMDQVYYDVTEEGDDPAHLPFRPTYHIRDLRELMDFL